MIEKRKTIFDYCNMVLLQYAITIIIMTILAILVGDDAGTISSMFSLGKAGLPASALFEFLLLSIISVFFRYLFFTDNMIKSLSVPIRGCLLIASIFLATAGFIVVFDWFPTDSVKNWMFFVLCFCISTIASLLVLVIKEKTENKKLEEALKSIQNGEEKEYE